MKNKLNKFFRRCIPLLSVFMVVVASIPHPVQAEDLSWKDYISDVNPESGTVTISLPVTPSTFDVYPSGLDVQSFNGVEYLLYTFESYEETGREYSLQITPGSSNFLFLGNVPDDTEINIWLDIRSVAYPEGDTVNGLPTVPVWNFDVGRYNAHLQYFDASHKRIALKYLDFGQFIWAGDDPTGESTTSQFYATHILKDPLGTMDTGEYFVNAQFFRTTYFLEGLRFHSREEVKISVTNFDIVFHMGSLLDGDGEYSDILEVILSELAKRGQTLNLITGNIENIPQIENNMNNAINGAGDSVQDLGQLGDALAGVDKPNLNPDAFSADQLVPQTSFIVLAMPFQQLWENRTLFGMLTIVVSLVLVSWLFFGKKR